MIDAEATWVLIFNAGQGNEGVYTLNPFEGGHAASVLCFESSDDADQFAHRLVGEGFDRPTPFIWDAEKLTHYCHSSGFKVEVVPLGEIPAPPASNDYDQGTRKGFSDPERKYPGDGTGRMDPYISYRMRLEALFPVRPSNCADDDCTLEPPTVDADPPAQGTPAQGGVRDEAAAAIEAILAKVSNEQGEELDLATLMKSAWEMAEASKSEAAVAKTTDAEVAELDDEDIDNIDVPGSIDDEE